MSGWPRWASSAPSRSRTIAWTIDWGWTTTSSRSNPTPNRWCASISSRPLFISVAESTVIFGPICQVGWASAWAGLTARRSAAAIPRNGPPDAVITIARSWSDATPCRHWAMRRVLAVDRQDAAIGPASGLGHQVAAGDEALLVGKGKVGTGGQRRQRGVEPGRADDRVQHHVGAAPGQLDHALRAGQHLALEARSRHPGSVRIGQRNPADTVLVGQAHQLVRAGCGGEGADAQLGVVAHHLERLHAHRASRAEDCDGLHSLSLAMGFVTPL